MSNELPLSDAQAEMEKIYDLFEKTPGFMMSQEERLLNELILHTEAAGIYQERGEWASMLVEISKMQRAMKNLEAVLV